MSATNDIPALRAELGESILSENEFRGENTLNVSLAALPKALTFCKEKLNYELLLDISSLDHFGDDPRFEVVYELASLDDTRHYFPPYDAVPVVLMWEGYPFFPLRKDFPLAGRPTDMPDVAFTGVAPLEGGPFVTAPGGETVAKREPRARHQE